MAAPPSQLPSQGLDRQLTTITLEKFSFAVSPVNSGSPQWVHDSRRDELFLVFQPIPQPQGEAGSDCRLVMSVSARSQTLERQDLGKLVAIVEDFEARRREGPVDPALELPVHVVVKVPCVALRYPTSPTLVRRIQMKFKNDSDYQRVLSIFEQLKFPIRNAGGKRTPTASLLPSRSVSAILVQNPSSSHFGGQPHVLGAADNYRTRASIAINNASYVLPRPLVTEESPLFMRSHSASSETLRPSSSWSLDGGRFSDTVPSISFGEPPVRPNSILDYVGPDSSILAFPFDRETGTPLTSSSRLVIDHLLQPAASQLQDQGAVRSKAMLEAFGPPLPPSQPSSTSENPLGPRQRIDNDRHIDRRISLIPEFLRPLSAPVTANSETPSQWLPPRRELPFQKARASTKPYNSTIVLQSSQPRIEAGEPHVNEVAHCVSSDNTTPIYNQSTKRVAQRRINDPPPVRKRNMSDSLAEKSSGVDEGDVRPQILVEREEEPSPLAGKSAALSRPSTAPGLPSKTMTTAARKRLNETQSDMIPVSKQARTTVDSSTQTQTWSGRDHTVPLTLTTCTEQSLSTAADVAIEPCPPNFMNEIETFVSKHKHRPPPEEIWQKRGYSEASPEERQKIINDFICENLDNEDFLKLCEDTGNVWRRIGLEI